MALSLLHLFEAALFFLNAMAILNEKRFLKKCKYFLNVYPKYRIDGWDRPDIQSSMDSAGVSFIKHQSILLLYTVRTYGKCKLYFTLKMT